jgi:hypothetical protein
MTSELKTVERAKTGGQAVGAPPERGKQFVLALAPAGWPIA